MVFIGEGNGTPLQYSCLENPMDGGAWKAAVHGVTEGRTRLSGFTFTLHFHALEEEMATHSSVLVWRIPGMGEPVGLPSMGSHRVGHDWRDLASAAAAIVFMWYSKPCLQYSLGKVLTDIIIWSSQQVCHYVNCPGYGLPNDWNFYFHIFDIFGKFISCSSKAWKVQDQGTCMIGSGPMSFLCVLT